MPIYRVMRTPLRHGTAESKKAVTVLPGEEIELKAKEASALGSNLLLVKEGKKAGKK